MATLIPNELTLRDQVKLAKENKERLAMEPGLLSVLAYGFYRYEEIQDALAAAGCGGKYPTVVQDVSRLIGEHIALQRFAEGSGSVPLDAHNAVVQAHDVLYDKILQWEEWADTEAPKCTSAHEQRESISARLKSG